MTRKNRSKIAKKCAICKKNLQKQNETGLCRHHYKMEYNQVTREERKNKGLCIQCGKKAERIITYPAGNTIPPIIKQPVRCYTCRKKEKTYRKRYEDKKIKLLSVADSSVTEN